MGSLEKATLLNLDKSEKFEILFNPREYTVRKSTQWEPHRSPGRDVPEIEFTSGHPMTLQMELFFDTYEVRKDVREHTDRILALASVDAALRRPPRILFAWGGFKFEGILEDVSQRFLMFTSSGMPVRAALNVTLKEYRPAKDAGRKGAGPQSNDARRRTVKQGETLPAIAAEEYGDPAEWRRIADANAVADPRHVAPGTVLTIPPRN